VSLSSREQVEAQARSVDRCFSSTPSVCRWFDQFIVKRASTRAAGTRSPPLVPPLFGSAEKLLKLTHKSLRRQFVVRTFIPLSLRSQFLQLTDFEWLKGDDGPPPLVPPLF
jgi:hypothetical protein